MDSKPNLEISTVVGCKMVCNYCPQSVHVRQYATRPEHPRAMSLDTFKTCLKSVPKDVVIMFAGMAEPWLNPQATDMLLYTYSEGYAVDVYTTTVGMTLADVARLKGIPFISFVIHLPDADGRMHLKVTDEYLQVLKAVMATIPHHFSVIGPVHPLVGAIIDRVVNDDSAGLYSRAGNLEGPHIPRKTGAIKCSACGPKLDHNVLLPNGDVVLCCMIYDLKHVIGNLVTGSYDELFTSSEYKRIKQGQAGDESVDIACRSCELAVPA